MTPVPGVRGLEHIGLTVPNLQDAIDFFVEVLGFEHFYDLGPFRDDEGQWFKENLDLDPRSVIPRAALLRCGHGSNLELFEYEAPNQDREVPLMSDWGGTHFAFYVDDMDVALADLERRGLRILGGAKEGIGPEAGPGTSWAHFLTPWGQLLELVSFPHGKVYMAGRSRVLWRPQAPAD